MDINISPFYYQGTICVPASKSYLQRAIALATLTKGTSIIHNINYNKDVDAVFNIVQQMGAVIENINASSIKITPIGKKENKIKINCKESGLAARMFGIIVSEIYNEVIINGEGSLLKRSMIDLIDALKQLQCDVQDNSGLLPLSVVRKNISQKIKINAAQTSQVLTGLLMALPLRNIDTAIEVEQLNSKPYIDITLDIMKCFGVTIEHQNYKTFFIRGKQQYIAQEYYAEGDWSGAAFHVVGAAISGEVLLNGLNNSSVQGDKIILDIVKQCGAEVILNEANITIRKKELNRFEFDATNYPDLFPSLAILGCACKGISVIYGTERLLQKESNRAIVIKDELNKLGAKIYLEDNKMIIEHSELYGGEVYAHNDHRIAMMAAISACISNKKIKITNTESVEKSYPNFFKDLSVMTMGAK